MVARIIDYPFYSVDTGPIPTPYNPDPTLLAIVEVIRDGLIRDQHVRLHKFGTFRLRWSKERQIKHPKTGEIIAVAPSPKITFTPARHLRELIEPDRQPSIPLNDPVKCKHQSNTAQKQPQHLEPNSTATIHYFDPGNTKQDHTDITECVQDIIDEKYSFSDKHTGDNLLEPVTLKIPDQGSAKKWALGLLASLPLILMLLQSDFTTNKNVTADTPNTSIATTQSQVKNPGNIVTNTVQTPEFSSPDNRQKDERSSVGKTPPTTSTARPEPTPKPFYMSPQLHTVQTGESLWKLAENFYGDPLLWPHIYRANMRTVSNPDKILEGKQLVIPGLQQRPENLSNKDRKLIAAGYYEVYKFEKTRQSIQAVYFLVGAKQFSPEWLSKHKLAIPHKDWKLLEQH